MIGSEKGGASGSNREACRILECEALASPLTCEDGDMHVYPLINASANSELCMYLFLCVCGFDSRVRG